MSNHEYVLGRTPEEYERLRRQARLWNGSTAELLDRAVLASGARCLDVGCGPGETMRLMAERVGPTGQVTGIDVDADLSLEALDWLHAAGHRQCVVIQADLDEDHEFGAVGGGGFDLVLTRIVLEHLTDPVAALRRMWQWTAPGGTLIVQAYNLRTLDVFPPIEAISEWHDVFAQLFPYDMGHRLPTMLADAGIGEPDGTHVAGRMERFDGAFSGVLIAAYRSALPVALKHGLTTEERSAAWFSEMSAAVATAGHHTALWPLLIGVHKRKPPA